MNRKTILRILSAVLAAFALIVFWTQRTQIDWVALDAWLQQAAWFAPILFVLIYAVATALFFPAIALTLLGGALFGPWWGTLFNLLGATLGASLAFLIARYLAADWVEAKAGERLQKFKHGVEGEGWRFVAFVRLVPLFPFVLLNYVLGLTRIRLSHYVITSFICMAPGGFAYTWLGHVGREAASNTENWIQHALIALALLAAVAFLPRLVRRLREHGQN